MFENLRAMWHLVAMYHYERKARHLQVFGPYNVYKAITKYQMHEQYFTSQAEASVDLPFDPQSEAWHEELNLDDDEPDLDQANDFDN